MEKLRSRYGQLVAVVLLLMCVLFLRLFWLTVLQNDQWKEEANNISTKNTYIISSFAVSLLDVHS